MASRHIVQQGECLSSIAARYGLADYRLVYEHPANAAFRKKRPNPNVILPGDELHIPDPAVKQVSVATGSLHKFVVKMPSRLLRLFLTDERDQPLGDLDYEIAIEGMAEAIPGKTKSNGLLEEHIPLRSIKATITLRSLDLSWSVMIGHLDPAHDPEEQRPVISGIQARLQNLGYYRGDIDGRLSESVTDALKRFQAEALGRTDPDGQPDRTTCEALVTRHGC